MTLYKLHIHVHILYRNLIHVMSMYIYTIIQCIQYAPTCTVPPALGSPAGQDETEGRAKGKEVRHVKDEPNASHHVD